MENLVEKVLPIIRSTRDITLPFYGKAESIAEKDGGTLDIVTELDRKVEKYLCDEFRKLDPSIGFVGEEFGGDRNVEKFWLVDPIDGTLHFVRGMPFCTTMVALVDKGEVVFSAIYNFVDDVMYHAEKGKGAFANREKISVGDRPITHSVVILETKLEKPANREIRDKVRAKSWMMQIAGSGCELALVASGKIEARIAADGFGKDYDYAPGALLVQEAGGFVRNLGSASYDYKKTDFIAGNRHVVEGFTEGPEAVFPISGK